jgi:hypothetical protein
LGNAWAISLKQLQLGAKVLQPIMQEGSCSKITTIQGLISSELEFLFGQPNVTDLIKQNL